SGRYARSQGGEAELNSQVAPGRIALFDQLELPRPVPLLEPLLAHDRMLHRGVWLEPDQHLDAILAGEARDGALPMLMDPLHQVRRDTDIERPAATRGEQVNARAELSLHG